MKGDACFCEFVFCFLSHLCGLAPCTGCTSLFSGLTECGNKGVPKAVLACIAAVACLSMLIAVSYASNFPASSELLVRVSQLPHLRSKL
jgi:hypothetical protein